MSLGPGFSPQPLDGAREAAVTRIQDAFALGAISHEDLDNRLHWVLTARTPSDVLTAVDSLPEPAPGREVNIVANSGKIRRAGTWQVPSVLRIESEYAKVRLDLSRAAFETPVVNVVLLLRFGSAKVIVPAEAVVDLDGLQAGWKQPRYRRGRSRDSAGPLVRFSGSMEYGRLSVRHRRR